MKKEDPYFLSIERAVARMINFDYIPEGFSLLDMTDAFREDAEVAYQNGKLSALSADELGKLRDRFDACEARHTLAIALLERLEAETKDLDSELDFDLTSDGAPRVSVPSLSTWAADNFGIGFSFDDPKQAPQPKWKDVTIKIYADYRLGWQVAGGKFHKSSFRQIGLMGRNKLKPNGLGLILLELSRRGGHVPYKASNRQAVLMSRLRSALKKLTDITTNPFLPPNTGDGWRPRFKLVDDQRNADERAKTRAQYVAYDDTRDYQAEDDEAGHFLKKFE